MADEREPDVIKIAGQEVTMFSWSMASRLSAAFGNLQVPEGEEPLTLKHQMAIAFQAGYDCAVKRGLPVVGIDVEETIRLCEDTADNLRVLKRKMT